VEINEPGVVLKPSQVSSVPKVVFEPYLNKDLYTLILTDPDAPSRAEPSMREYVHWMVTNIPGNDIASGDEILSYQGAAPPYGTGQHRYVFTIYLQSAPVDSAYIASAKRKFAARAGVKTSTWASALGMGNFPIALTGFLAEWEESVDEIHANMGWLPPEHLRSPGQKDVETQKVLHQAKKTLCETLKLGDIFTGAVVAGVKYTDVPTVTMDIAYRGASGESIPVVDGNQIEAKLTVKKPHQVQFTPRSPDDFYTLILCDPDAPTKLRPVLREFIHWVVMNIPGGDVAAGVEIASYVGACPPYQSGVHRYCFCLYKQAAKFSPAEIATIKSDTFNSRTGIRTALWAAGAGLGTFAVAINVFTAEWDDSVSATHKSIDFLPPTEFLAPEQIQEAEKRKQQAKAEEAKKKDQERLQKMRGGV